MANVTHFTKQRVIEAIRSGKGLAKPTARLLGCDPSVVRRWVKVDPEVANAMEQASEDHADDVEEILYDLAVEERDLDAIKFYLKAKGKRRGYSEQVMQSSNAVIDLWLEEISGRKKVEESDLPKLIDQPAHSHEPNALGYSNESE